MAFDEAYLKPLQLSPAGRALVGDSGARPSLLAGSNGTDRTADAPLECRLVVMGRSATGVWVHPAGDEHSGPLRSKLTRCPAVFCTIPPTAGLEAQIWITLEYLKQDEVIYSYFLCGSSPGGPSDRLGDEQLGAS